MLGIFLVGVFFAFQFILHISSVCVSITPTCISLSSFFLSLPLPSSLCCSSFLLSFSLVHSRFECHTNHVCVCACMVRFIQWATPTHLDPADHSLPHPESLFGPPPPYEVPPPPPETPDNPARVVSSYRTKDSVLPWSQEVHRQLCEGLEDADNSWIVLLDQMEQRGASFTRRRSVRRKSRNCADSIIRRLYSEKDVAAANQLLLDSLSVMKRTDLLELLLKYIGMPPSKAPVPAEYPIT